MSMAKFNLKNVSLSEQIYNLLKKQIIDGKINHGERLVIDKIANEIGVSSTPVRDALRLLVSSGFAEKKNNDGIFIIDLSKKDVIELFDMREVLEGLAVRLLTKKLDCKEIECTELKTLKVEFEEKEKELLERNKDIPHELDIKLHDLLLKLSPNKRLKKQIKLMMNQTYRIRKLQHQSKVRDIDNHERLLRETQEHINIIDSILKGESEEAEYLMREHIKNAKKDILSQIKF